MSVVPLPSMSAKRIRGAKLGREGRAAGDDALREALAGAVEPDVDGVVTHLDDVGGAVLVDVAEVDPVELDVELRRWRRHADLAPGALPARARRGAIAPDALAAARPPDHTAAADLDDVLDAVAVHVGDAELGIGEVDGEAVLQQARLERVGAQGPARCRRTCSCRSGRLRRGASPGSARSASPCPTCGRRR